MIFWICPKLAGKHQDRVIVRATELRTFCRTALQSQVRGRANAPARVTDQVRVRSRVTDLLRRTVPIGSTTVKTINKIVWTIRRTSETFDKTQFPTAGTISKSRSLIGETTKPETAKIIAIISATIVLVASTTLMSNGRIVLSDVMKFTIR